MSMAHKILIVEDNKDLRETMVEFLEFSGFDVTSAQSAAEFYNVVTKGGWCVVVVDIGLPDQSGFTLVEYLRSNTNVRVIILTANDSLDDKVKGYGLGADLYLVKPIDCRELAAAISSLAQRHVNGLATPMAPSLNITSTQVSANIWKLESVTWSLITPDGVRISLTAKEQQFFDCFDEGDGSIAEREYLLGQLYQRSDEYTSRSLDSLVRRLRIKIMQATHLDVPIKTIHAVGYCFTARLQHV